MSTVRFSMVAVMGLVVCVAPSAARAGLSSGVIDDARAGDWSRAGLPNGLPDASWTQCGSTIAAYSGTADAINTQIKTCGPNEYVLLGPGKFALSSSIDFGHKASFVLRGSGAGSTELVFSAATSVDCNLGASAAIGICSTDKTDLWSNPPVFHWTDGLGQGSTTLTLSATTGIAPGSLLFLSQDDDGYTGYPATGASVDNGTYFVCADAYKNGPTGCAYNGPDGNPPSPFTHRWQYEVAVVSSVNGNVVTIAAPVRHPNWRASQAPTAMLMQPLRSSGVEDLSIDIGSNKNISYAIDIAVCDGCWVSGVAVHNVYNWAIGEQWSTHGQLQNNYIYNGSGPDPYGMRLLTTGDTLIVNNIFHKMRASLVFDEPDCGSVVAYNYSVNQFDGADAMFLAFWPHSAGDDYELFEGNVSNGIVMDDSHGGHLNQTMFRNFNTGWESCANGNCGGLTKDWGVTPMRWPYAMRYGNVVGNVSGTPGFHKVYEASSFGGCAQNQCSIYSLGETNPAATPPIPSDPLVASTMLRWGNWDTVTKEVHFCGSSSDTGFATTCAGKSEVPTGAALYPNAIPTKGDTAAGQPALPASFYYASKPAWFGAVPWPPIGPDVQNGDVGQCTGTLDTKGQFAGLPATKDAQCTGASLAQTAWGGHVNAIPAMACYLALGGLPDGTGSAVPFDAKTCYTNANPGGVDGGARDASSPDGGSSTPPNGGTPGGCGCYVAPSSSSSATLAAWALAAAAVLVRRKRR